MPLGRVRGGRPRLPVRTSSEHRSNITWPYRRSPSVINARPPVVLITLTSVRIARLKSLRSLRPHRSSQIKRDARSSSTIVHPLASSGGRFFLPWYTLHRLRLRG